MYFISDLHLCQEAPHVDQLFKCFMRDRANQVEQVFILGDLFNVWLGDDLASDYANTIANGIHRLKDKGIRCYFMPGNRDFLLGETFAARAGMLLLPDPYLIQSTIGPILLSHGDALCTADRKHQWFRKISQHPTSKKIFQKLSKRYREAIGNGVRRHSANHARYCNDAIDLKLAKKWLVQHNCRHLIHGHIHQAGIHHECLDGYAFKRCVMGSWEEATWVLHQRNGHDIELQSYP